MQCSGQLRSTGPEGLESARKTCQTHTTHIHMCTRMHTQACTHTQTYYTGECIHNIYHTRMHGCIHTHTHVHVYTHTLDICTHSYTQYDTHSKTHRHITHTHTHTHMHTHTQSNTHMTQTCCTDINCKKPLTDSKYLGKSTLAVHKFSCNTLDIIINKQHVISFFSPLNGFFIFVSVTGIIQICIHYIQWLSCGFQFHIFHDFKWSLLSSMTFHTVLHSLCSNYFSYDRYSLYFTTTYRL